MEQNEKTVIDLKKLATKEEVDYLNMFIEKSLNNWKDVHKDETINETISKAKALLKMSDYIEHKMDLDSKPDSFVIKISMLTAENEEEAERLGKEIVENKIKEYLEDIKSGKKDIEKDDLDISHENVSTISMTKTQFIEAKAAAEELVSEFDNQIKMLNVVGSFYKKLSAVMDYYSDKTW